MSGPQPGIRAAHVLLWVERPRDLRYRTGCQLSMIAPRRLPESGSLEQTVSGVFSESGLLSRSPDFEYRPGQQAMAEAVAAALEHGEPLVVEAGTGVGKSLAYLVPAALHAVQEGRKAVISTHTINLQEQLLTKDVPIVQKLFPDRVRAVLLKGRQNYVCPSRLERAMEGAGDLFTSSETEELRALWTWCQTTRDGTLTDIPFSPSPRVWSQVCSEAHACTVKRCGPTGRCFYQEVRKRIGDSDIVVLNHTLFFTLLSQVEDFGVGEDGFLFPDDFVVFDEAHTLENVAARQLGLLLSQGGLRFDIQRLYNPRTKKGLFALARSAEGVRSVAHLLDEVAAFFRSVEGECGFRGPSREFRVRRPGLVTDSLTGPLLAVQQLAGEAAEEVKREGARSELQELARRLRDARATVARFLDHDLEDHVYWVERGGEGRGEGSLSLNAAPVDVAGQLRRVLFGEGKTAVLTSATLGTGDDELLFFRRRVGALGARALKIGSPFDYDRQMKLYVVRSMPEPAARDYPDALARWIAHFLAESDARAFVLFTSYRQMIDSANRLEGFVRERGWTFLVQGRGIARHRMLEEFRDSGRGVLFGTDSFWTGVDVPGEALTNVVITRLPFAVPDHPLTASRLERIEQDGGNPFVEYSVPEAVLKLRQGIGRLIRSRRDRGIAAILDPRILTKPYGRTFLGALPVRPQVVEGEGLAF